MKTYLVTGAAGFIGFHLAKYLLDRNIQVVGLDNVNDYYSVQLKRDRLAQLQGRAGFDFVEIDLIDSKSIERLFTKHKFDRVVHLAAQVGVRYSVTNPRAYTDSNIVGFINLLEGCRHAEVPHLTYASSSSVYGANTQMPFSVHQNVDHPVSLYAATKKANELMAHTYSHLYKLPTTGLRFFTVYGPWGRPDMALFLFTKAILSGEPINVFNHGKMRRDFTYVDDIVEGVYRASEQIAEPNPEWSSDRPEPGSSYAPFRLYNIGNNQPVELNHFIGEIEQALGMKASRNMLPMQPGDVPVTFADISELEDAVGFRPSTTIEEGVARFVQWYRGYYQMQC
ncbi:MAG: NAD-dependent epimerase [Planctomycetes bacterium]|nr:NAD-dependent epimerase [Planctomycetota bacterium]